MNQMPLQQEGMQTRQEHRRNYRDAQRTRNDSTFGSEMFEGDYNEDFDFEGNLKLFDKKVLGSVFIFQMYELCMWLNSKLIIIIISMMFSEFDSQIYFLEGFCCRG